MCFPTCFVQICHYSLFESVEQCVIHIPVLSCVTKYFGCVTSYPTGGFPVLPLALAPLFLTDTVAGQEHGSGPVPATSNAWLGCIPLVWLQGSGWICGTMSPAWVSASLRPVGRAHEL